jgi:acyl-CoA synthetase (NDP forming)
MQLEALFQPRSIAVIGASEKPTVGRRVVASLDRIGFTGRIYPVNPSYPTVLGHACYASMAELPEEPDVAVFCLGNARVLGAFVAAAERGIKGAVIYDGGFAEQGEDGRQLQGKIEGICREADIALCGPNCMGVLNPHHPSTTYLQELRNLAGLDGNVGIVSQSGGFCISLLSDTRRFGFSHVVSSGNEAVLAAADYLEYLVEDPRTEAIGAFIETIRQPDRFSRRIRPPLEGIALYDCSLSVGRKNSGSRLTPRWRKPDSNHRSRVTRPSFRRRLMSLLLDSPHAKKSRREREPTPRGCRAPPAVPMVRILFPPAASQSQT